MIFYIPGFPLEHRKRPQRIFHTAAVFFNILRFQLFFSHFRAMGGVFGILEAIDYICDMIY